MTTLTIGILECDQLSPELIEQYQCYSAMFKRLILSVAPAIECRVFNVLDGHLPEDLTQCDAYLLTGSKTGVYDAEPWLADLSAWVKAAYAFKVPLAGFCFGHQFLNHHLGGYAAKSEKGWGLGVMTHARKLDAAWLAGMPTQLNLLYSHQDQVVAVAEHAQLLYGSEFCQVGATWQAGRLLTFQGHPEFTKAYSRALMTLRRERYRPDEYQQAMCSLDVATDEIAVAQCLLRFFKGEDLS